MNTIDIILSLIIAFGIVRGFMRGFIYEIAVLGTLAVCYFLGFKLADMASVYIEKIIHTNPATLHFISLLLVWIAISICAFFLVKLFEGLINIIALGIFNKIAGAIFGGIKYAFLLSLFLYFFNKINITSGWFSSEAKAESNLYYPVLKISTSIFGMLDK